MPKLSDEVQAVLCEWAAVREVARICAADGPLDAALESLCNELRRAARRRSQVLAKWHGTPWREGRSIGFTLSACEQWRCYAEPLGVFYWCPNPADPERLDDNPYVSFRVPGTVPNAELLREKVGQHVPMGFTKHYPGGDPDPADVFWKYIAIDDPRFIGGSEWKAETFLAVALEAMEQAASVRPIIDEFLGGTPAER